MPPGRPLDRFLVVVASINRLAKFAGRFDHVAEPS